MAIRLPSFLKALTGKNGQKARVSWRSTDGDPVVGLDHNGTIVAVTGAAETMIGGNDGPVGRSFLEFIARDDRAALKEALTRVSANMPSAPAIRLTVRLLAQAGDDARKSPRFVELALANNKDGTAILIRDRSEELNERRTANMTANGATTAEAEHGVSADMLADLGHELKTPLNAIMGFAETMRTETFGPLGHEKYNEYADLIHSSGGHLAELISAILDRAKLAAGRYEIAPVLSAPGPLAKTCAEMVRGETEKAGLSLNIDIAENLPETMLDCRTVKQILINLLSNAVKFTADGEVSLNVRETDGTISFTVADTGVGMSQIALARLGERFTDMHKNGVRGTAGTGLGLSLAFAMAKLHGGMLSLSSAPGEGTVATLTLPVAKTAAELSASGVSAARAADIQSQLDRVAQYRRERMDQNAA
ncbi:PAS domain-containing sensor histidine kinase [Hyphococcus lacteus]|uniref:histidine kinase n=1 Tax=Hyphococcus lacteus TaxID=3143536 RepID=A0ABV3Z499_9PROT